ncbi:MAG TPA: Mur ligase family protein, partial [Zoogloea sp.]|nr:Mur ligase family protein [Zoogloea sp.]
MQLPESLDGWLGLLEARHGQSIQLGLDRVRAVRDALQLPQTCPVFTVGGTNGKGSTCAMLEAVLLAAGYRVGVYTSPHLLHYNERVRIDGRDVSDSVLVDAFGDVERARGEIPLTYFEHGTLAAWVAFSRAGLDAVILEVGLGGRLDAVNVFEPDCAIVTSVAMDHMDYLGDTREAIGFEKAGIFRSGCPAICSDPMPPASLIEHAEAIGAKLWVSGRDFGFSGDQNQWAFWTAGGSRRGGLAYPSLRGTNQLLNAAAVMAACEAVRDILPVPMQAVRQGF